MALGTLIQGESRLDLLFCLAATAPSPNRKPRKTLFPGG